jgi:hypothetical protein
MHSNVLASAYGAGSLASNHIKGGASADAPSTISLGSDSDSSISPDNSVRGASSHTGNSPDNSVRGASSHTGNSPDNSVRGASSHTGNIEGKPQLEYYNVCINHHCYNYHNPLSEED